MKQIYYIKMQNTFLNLLTNPKDVDLTEAHEAKDGGFLHRTSEYVQQVELGDGKRAHCPFVKMIAKANGYYVRAFTMVHLEWAIEMLEACFKEFSPGPTHLHQKPDPVTAVAAFFEETAMSPAFCEILTKKRAEVRQHFLNQGLMIAEMHPHHKLGSGKEGSTESSEELYVAGIPLLMVRRMHKEDHVFMRTEPEKAAYAKYFDEIHVAPTCPYHHK